MFEPEIFGLSSSALWGFAQALLTPTLGFLFIFILGLPIADLRIAPGGTSYKQPQWALPLFAHASTFALVAIVATTVALNYAYEPELAGNVREELFLTRELNLTDKRITKASVIVRRYDGFSNFRVVANGYHVFGSHRDCVTTFQCKVDAAKAGVDAQDFKKLRVTGGSLYDFSRTNDLPYEIALNHYLARGENFIDIMSENAGTGGCVLDADIVVATDGGEQRYRIDISPERGSAPMTAGPLAANELFHSGGEIATGTLIEPYKTPKLERRNSVCQRIRISLELSDAQAQALSGDAGFSAYFLQLHKRYVCETIGTVIPGCEAQP